MKNIGLALAGKIASGKAPVELEVPNPKSAQMDNLLTKIAAATESVGLK